MSQYSKRERIEAISRGEPADRPPVMTYHHFLAEEKNAAEFVDATVQFQKKYDWDVLKINPRAVYLTETWGNEYDYSEYIGYGPKCVKNMLSSSADLERIQKKSMYEGPLAEQLWVVKQLREKIGPDTPIIQTIFSPIAVVLNLTGTRMPGRYREADRLESPIVKFMQENPEGLHRALGAMADTMASYAKELLKCGADGVFYSPLGLAREGYLTHEERVEFMRKYDLRILEEIKGAFVVLHTCGINSNPEFFVDYPISVLHWAESAPGNPTLESSKEWLGNKAMMGGVDERLFGKGNEKTIEMKARKAVSLHKNRPFMLAPECSVAPESTHAELMAIRSAVE